MSKVITSPFDRFPGTVTLADPMLLEQAVAWERARERADDLLEWQRDENGKIVDGTGKFRPGTVPSEREAIILEGVRACVEAWNLEGYDPQKPPYSPKAEVTNLVTWLMNEVNAVYYGIIPNG